MISAKNVIMKDIMMARKDSGSADATDPLMKMIGLRWRMSGGKVAALLPPTKFANYCSGYIFNRTANKETLDCDLDKKVAQSCFNVILLNASK